MKLAFALIPFLAWASCQQAKQKAVEKKTGANTEAIAEERRANNTGAVDALSVAPTNPPTALALELVKRNQQIDGVPRERIPVAEILAGHSAALVSLRARYDRQDDLLGQRAKLEEQLKATNERLVEMGRLYEQEKNTHIVKRVWRWLFSTLGLAGIVALCIFCPAVIPIFTHLAAWIVGKIPKLAGALGVVGKSAFDAVVSGVGEVRSSLKAGNAQTITSVDSKLTKATVGHTSIIEARRKALAV